MRYVKPKPNSDGWTDWQNPNMECYNLVCCDCGLAHTFQFKVIPNIGSKRRLSLEGVESMPYIHEGHALIFRAKRNERATAQIRRWRKKRESK